jgi:hypothetical protein
MSEDKIQLCFMNRIHNIYPDFNLVREIEGELDSLKALQARLAGQSWGVAELVTLIHMLLSSAGESVDYLQLGNLMLKEGLSRYHAAALSFLQLVLQ